MSTTLYRQESEVENELKQALEEACFELGVTLSNAFSPSVSSFPTAWWLFDANQGEPSLADLAGWLSISRRRSYRPSPLNKYRKYAVAPVDDGQIPSGEGLHHQEPGEAVISASDESEVELPQDSATLKERLSNAVELDVLAKDFNWGNLLSVHRTEHAQESDQDDDSDRRESTGSVEVTVNSGGVVYFAMFRNSHVGFGGNGMESEAAAVFKFGSSRLATQSERLGIEIARHLGVLTPQSRVVHSNTPEWTQLRAAVQAVKATAEADENEIGLQTSEELLEALRLSRCMLLMGFIRGRSLAESDQAFAPEKVAVRTATALGRTLVLDMVLRNEDRLFCQVLGWRGNPGNLLVTAEVPLGSENLGPPAQDPQPPSAISRQRRTQSLTAVSDHHSHHHIQTNVHRAPSPELTHLGTAPSQSAVALPDHKSVDGVKRRSGGGGGKEEEEEEEEEEFGFLVVAIDSGVSRRPPGMKVDHDRRAYSKTVELLLHDEQTAASILGEVSFGHLGSPPMQSRVVTKAFQRGVVDAIRDMQVLRMFLVKLYRTLGQLLREFMLSMSSQPDVSTKQESSLSLDAQSEEPAKPSEAQDTVESATPQKPSNSSSPDQEPVREKSPRFSSLKISPSSSIRSSPGSSPRLSSSPKKISPLRENWHGKGSPGRLTFKLKDVSKSAKVDTEVCKKMEWWDEKLRREGQKLCKEHSFTTGFLEGGGSHSLVDSYELKVRLEHILERMTMISNGSDTEKPSCVIAPHLFIGSALSARSVHTLQHLGITHILCLCPSDFLEDASVGDFPDLFTYKQLAAKDVENEDISAHFQDACAFIEQAEQDGKAVLVHCFEGKSRSATVVLAYLMLRKGHTLSQAWSILKAAHRRTQPNDGFMKALLELDRTLHGQASMSFLKRRPAGQRCPICGKIAGLSLVAVHQHIRRTHPGIPLPPPPAPLD